jgi:hypothetical protein
VAGSYNDAETIPIKVDLLLILCKSPPPESPVIEKIATQNAG